MFNGNLRLIVEEKRNAKLASIQQKFSLEFYENHMDAICTSSIHNYWHRVNLSRKNLDFVHRGQDMAEQDEYLQSLRHIPPDKIFDIEGTCESPKDFQPKKGSSTVGTPAAYTQVVINTTTVAAVAAYTPFGSVAWEFYDESVTGDIADFIERKVKPFWLEDDFEIFDNASNQRTELARDAMEDVFGRRYRYCPAYSPWLKPVERGFSNVKGMIRGNGFEAQVDPIGLLNRCFHHFSFGSAGEGGSAGDVYISLNFTYQE
jgi:hypothetical protein